MLNIIARAAVMILISFFSVLISPKIISFNQESKAYEGEAALDVQKKNNLATVATIKAKKDDREKRLRNFLSANRSPLTAYSKELIKIADKYGLDWRLLPAIAGVESNFGLYIPFGSYNPYGWNNGNFYFKNWTESTEYVASQIREKWGHFGTITPHKIGPFYAASPNWSYKVSKYMTAVSLN